MLTRASIRIWRLNRVSKTMRTDRFPSGELINRLKPIEFTFDGKQIDAFEGDTLGSALAAKNIKVLSRSFKYHRPRGLLCVSGQCPNCLVEVNGSPNIRACTTKVENKMDVKVVSIQKSSCIYANMRKKDSKLRINLNFMTLKIILPGANQC